MILTAEFEGGQAKYLKFGSGKTLFVMLPGLSLPNVLRSADAIENAYSAFSKDYTVYLFDRIKNPPAGYTLGQMAEDTARSIEAAGIENACVFGASQGGMLALLTAAEHPRLVSKLAVGSTAVKSYKNIQIIMEQWVKLANEKNIRALAENIAGNVFSPATLKNAKKMIVNFNSDVSAQELEDFSVLAAACLSFDFTAELGKISCPTLVIGCEGDAIMPHGASEYIAGHIKGSELYMYDEKYGHAVYDEARDYKNKLFDFFGG